METVLALLPPLSSPTPPHLGVLQRLLADVVDLGRLGRVVNGLVEGVAQVHHLLVEEAQALSDPLGRGVVLLLS